MNIYYLDENPKIAARTICDQHLSKTITYAATILSTVCSIKGLRDDTMYLPTKSEHPCTVWASQTMANVEWLVEHAKELCRLYKLLTKESHNDETMIGTCWLMLCDPAHYDHKGFQEPALVISSGLYKEVFEEYKDDVTDLDIAVIAYCKYYVTVLKALGEKPGYKGRIPPQWLREAMTK